MNTTATMPEELFPYGREAAQNKFPEMLNLYKHSDDFCLVGARKKLTDADLQELCQSVWPKRLRDLKVELRARLTDRGKSADQVEQISKRPLYFSCVDLSDNGISSTGVQHLMNFLWKQKAFVRKFWLHKNEIGSGGLTDIADYLDWTYHKCWREWKESNSDDTNGEAAAGKPSLLVPISEIHLSDNKIRMHGFLNLCEALAEIPRRFLPSKPMWIRIGNNQIVVEGKNSSANSSKKRKNVFSAVAEHLREIRVKALCEITPDMKKVEDEPVVPGFRVIREVSLPESKCRCTKTAKKADSAVPVCPHCGRTSNEHERPLAVFMFFEPQTAPPVSAPSSVSHADNILSTEVKKIADTPSSRDSGKLDSDTHGSDHGDHSRHYAEDAHQDAASENSTGLLDSPVKATSTRYMDETDSSAPVTDTSTMDVSFLNTSTCSSGSAEPSASTEATAITGASTIITGAPVTGSEPEEELTISQEDTQEAVQTAGDHVCGNSFHVTFPSAQQVEVKLSPASAKPKEMNIYAAFIAKSEAVGSAESASPSCNLPPKWKAVVDAVQSWPAPHPRVIAETEDMAFVEKPAGWVFSEASELLRSVRKTDNGKYRYFDAAGTPQMLAWCLDRFGAESQFIVNSAVEGANGVRFMARATGGFLNRLDLGVSGVHVVAKTKARFELLFETLNKRDWEKYYVCLVPGILGDSDAGSGEHVKGKLDRKRSHLDAKLGDGWRTISELVPGRYSSSAADALTLCRPLAHYSYCVAQKNNQAADEERPSDPDDDSKKTEKEQKEAAPQAQAERKHFTLLQVRILTGRRNQIRHHMSFLGGRRGGIVGEYRSDKGLKRSEDNLGLGEKRLFLHSQKTKVKMNTPEGPAYLEAESELPPDLQNVLDEKLVLNKVFLHNLPPSQWHKFIETQDDTNKDTDPATGRTGDGGGRGSYRERQRSRKRKKREEKRRREQNARSVREKEKASTDTGVGEQEANLNAKKPGGKGDGVAGTKGSEKSRGDGNVNSAEKAKEERKKAKKERKKARKEERKAQRDAAKEKRKQEEKKDPVEK